MSHFLVIYDRHRCHDPAVQRIDDAQEAQERLFATGRELEHDPDHGVVLLVAEREEDLPRTHGQYFKSVDELRRLVSA
jgi:hypothetical protein